MRIAIISDIHGNIDALEAVFKNIDASNIDEIVCLGDIVGYGVNPNECIDMVRNRCTLTLLGNHDAATINQLSTENFNIHAKLAIDWTKEHLTEKSFDFLKNLDIVRKDSDKTLVHSTPYEPQMWYYITSLEEAAFNFKFFDTKFCFIGHTHIPMIIVLNEEKNIYLHKKNTIEFSETPQNRMLINVGSVGQPRDRNSQSCYGILDTTIQSFTYQRVSYNISKVQAKMRKEKMPDFLISRIGDGK